MALQNLDNPSAKRNDQPGLTLTSGWDIGWNNAKSAVGTSPQTIAFIGDSFTHGTNSADPLVNGWVGRLRTSLLQSTPLYADYWPAFQNSVLTGAVAGANWAWTINDTGNIVNFGTARGLSGSTEISLGTGGALPQLTFTSAMGGTSPLNVPFTSCDIVYLDFSAGSFQYSVDGAAAVTVTTTTSQTVKKINITGLANTTHTITFGNQTVAASCRICGITTYSGNATGYGFARHGYYGNSLWIQWAAQSAHLPLDHMLLLRGQWNGNATTGAGFPTQPQLTFIAMGINDNGSDHGVDVFEYGLRRMIDSIRRGSKDASIVLIGNYNNDTTYSDGSLTFGNSSDWSRYLARMQTVAETMKCAFVNFQARWGMTPVADGWITNANAHPTDQGHADMATFIGSIL